MTEEPTLEGRIAAVEDRLASEYRAKSLAGFRSLYAALSVALVVLPWFPAYGPVQKGEQVHVHEPLLLAPSGFLIFWIVVALVSLLLAAVFARRRETASNPVLAGFIAAPCAILMLVRYGATGEPELTAPGCAMVTVLFAITILGLVHAVVLGSGARVAAAPHTRSNLQT